MSARSPLTLVTAERVRGLERIVAALDALDVSLAQFLKQGIPLPFAFHHRVHSTLIASTHLLQTMRPALAQFPWTLMFVDFVLGSNNKASSIESGLRKSRERRFQLQLLDIELDSSLVYLHRLLAMLPPNVELGKESELFWGRSTISRLRELPTRQRRKFWAWVAIGIYGIVCIFATWAALWYPILFTILPPILFPVVLKSGNLVAYPGIIPSAWGYSGEVALLALAVAEAHALYGYIDILLRVDKIRAGFRNRWEERLHQTQSSEQDRMLAALKQWPDSWTKHNGE